MFRNFKFILKVMQIALNFKWLLMFLYQDNSKATENND